MTKRVALARALALDPGTCLSRRTYVRSRSDFGRRLRRADPYLTADLGLTVFMVTHDLDSLYSVCDPSPYSPKERSWRTGRYRQCFPASIPGSNRIFVGSAVSLLGATTSTFTSLRLRDGNPRALYIDSPSYTFCLRAAFAFVYWLNHAGGLTQQTLYRARFENTVSGLLNGSAVLFNGIRVGEIVASGIEP